MVMLFLGSTNASAAPLRPNQERIDEIQAVLDKRKLAVERVNSAGLRKKNVEDLIGLRDALGQPLPLNLRVEEYAKRLLGLGNEVYEDYANLTRDYKLAQEELQTLSTTAIELAKNAYHTTPAKSSGTIVSGPPLPTSADDIPGFIGESASYTPKYSERLPQNTSGTTDDAGNVLIGPDAFDSPGKLAFTLYHEGEHFERLLTPSLNLRNLPQEEVSARERQKPLLKDTFDFSDKAIDGFDKVLAADKSRAEKWRQLMVQGLDPYKLSHQPAFPPSRGPMRLEDDVDEEVDRILARTKELREQERREQAERIEELARLERKKRAFREEMDTEAAACGYRITYDTDNETMLGFGYRGGGFILGRNRVPFDFGDLKVVFLMTRTCQEIELHTHQPPPTACNGAASLLHERVGRGDFEPKLRYLTATTGFTYSDMSECVKELLATADSITDSKSFDKAASAYQKRLSKRLTQEAKRDRDREQEERERQERDRKREERDRAPASGTDPDCRRNGDPFGCQPRHP